jgi:two-component system, OmpR family, alkaline phosphatase synthesis response regulator PhoP
MEPLLVHPDPPPPELAQALDLGGYAWKAVGDEMASARLEPDDGWGGAVILVGDDAEAAFALARSVRKRDVPLEPLLLLISGALLGDLDLRDELYDDFCLHPFHPRELEARLRHMLWRSGTGSAPDLVEYGGLVLNLETYQAAIEGRPLDLTYMEYELLKFLAQHPGRVFTRETLLSRVWGYEYYGGARTVDVHIRRLRAKLGEEHANLISTVRSVGYRFGQSRWR